MLKKKYISISIPPITYPTKNKETNNPPNNQNYHELGKKPSLARIPPLHESVATSALTTRPVNEYSNSKKNKHLNVKIYI